MKGGTVVPALPSNKTAETALQPYKKYEVVTSLQFSETQAQIVLNGGEEITESGANYMRVARTTSQALNNYSQDSAPAYYWVDDMQLLGTTTLGDPAVLVTFSPDVWLTDFFAPESVPKVFGRVAQTTIESHVVLRERRESAMDPVQSWQGPAGTVEIYPYADVDWERPPWLQGKGYFCVAVYSSENSQIFMFKGDKVIQDPDDVAFEVWMMGQVVKTTMKLGEPYEGQVAQTVNLTPLKIYVLPTLFYLAIRTDDSEAITLQTGGNPTVAARKVEMPLPLIAHDTYNVVGISANGSLGFNSKYWNNVCNDVYLCTPKRKIKIRDGMGAFDLNSGANFIAFFEVFAAGSSYNSTSLVINLFINGEVYDIAEDFEADFAVNAEALSQSQNQELYAIRGITNAIGAIGGAVGGFASGNFFGGVQAIAGGVNGVAERRAARRTPADVKTAGGSILNTITTYGSLWLEWVIAQNAMNMNEHAGQYGYLLPNEPYMDLTESQLLNQFVRFSEVDVIGVGGGQYSAQEIAQAFLRGVRLKTL